MRLHHKNHPNRRLKEQRQKWIFDYKKDKCCQMCGWNAHPEILEFHHIKRAMENLGVVHLALGKRGIEKATEEMKKCILLCPNCHTWHHKVHGKERFRHKLKKDKHQKTLKL